jgi:hypothetical protein
LGGRYYQLLPEQKRQVKYDTGKPSLTAEFNPTNPLEQGLGDRFFGPFLGDILGKGEMREFPSLTRTEEAKRDCDHKKRFLAFKIFEAEN